MNARIEKFFKDPLEFKPERFLKSVENPDLRYVLLSNRLIINFLSIKILFYYFFKN